LAACTECNNTLRDVLRVVTTMSTQDLDDSLGTYSNLIPKLRAAADQSGCKFNFDKASKLITGLAQELKNAQRSEVRFKAGKLAAAPKIEQAPLKGPRTIDRTRVALDPIKIGGDTGGTSTGTAGSTSGSAVGSKSFSQNPAVPGLGVIDLGKGTTGFLFQDPEHKGQNYIGYQVTDPATGEMKTYAYPISAEDAAKIAKDPSLCANYITRAQVAAQASGKSHDDALKAGEDLKASWIAKMDANEKGQGQNGSDRNTASASANSAQPDSNESDDSNTEPKQGAATAAASSTSKTSNAAPDAYRVGAGLGSSTGVRTDGIATGTGLKFGSGVGLRGTSKMTPSGAGQNANANPSSENEPSEKTDSAQGRDAEQEYQSRLAARGSLSEPNGVEYNPNSTSVEAKSQKANSSQKTRSKPHSKAKAKKHVTQTKKLEVQTKNPEAQASKPQAQAQANKPQASKPEAQANKPEAQVKKTDTQAAKPEAQTKKPSNKPSVQAAAKSSAKKAEQEKPATYTGVTLTSEGRGHVRYFLVNQPPRVPFIGRAVEVNGKTQIVYYNLSSDANQLNELSHDPEKLKNTFEQRHKSQNVSAPHFMYLAPNVDNRLLESTLLNQALER
jgi:hypothetical protein